MVQHFARMDYFTTYLACMKAHVAVVTILQPCFLNIANWFIRADAIVASASITDALFELEPITILVQGFATVVIKHVLSAANAADTTATAIK